MAHELGQREARLPSAALFLEIRNTSAEQMNFLLFAKGGNHDYKKTYLRSFCVRHAARGRSISRRGRYLDHSRERDSGFLRRRRSRHIGAAQHASRCHERFGGKLYIADKGNNRIRKIDTSGIITTVAGNGTAGYSGDGGPATSAALNAPYRVALDSAGNIFIADAGNNRIRKVDTSGIITTVAGNGTGASYSGDGGPATSAAIWSPYGLAVDSAGNLYIADTGNMMVRKVDASGIITMVNGAFGIPYDVAVDSAGNLYVADGWIAHKIYKRDTSGNITTVAGNGTQGYSGDGGPATSASLNLPTGVAVDPAGNIYIADNGNSRIRKVEASGIITTVAGNGTAGYSGDGGPAVSASLKGPAGVAAGSVLIADADNHSVRSVVMSAGLPKISVNPSELNFGKVVKGTTATQQSVTITNIGDLGSQLVIGEPWTASPYFVNSNSCTTPLHKGASCTVSISLTTPAIGPSLEWNRNWVFIISNDTSAPLVEVDLWAVVLAVDSNSTVPTSVVSSNSTISNQTVTETNTISGLPTDFIPDCALSFTATDVNGTADIGISCDPITASSKAFKKRLDGSLTEIYPTNQCNGIDGVSVADGLMFFRIADNSACDLNSATGTIDDPIIIGSVASTSNGTPNLVTGWNLLGNSSSGALDVAATFGDANKVATVWKWIASQSKWAFYTPMQSDGGAAHAAGKGYDFLSSIAGGEGFWVNAKTSFSAQLPAGTAITSASFQSMSQGWNLISVGDSPTPSAFNKALSATPPAAGEIPLNLTTLWAWDAAQSNWYFYAPSLEKNGTLSSYIQSKSYLDFGTKVLDPAMGFWVNKP